MDKEIKLSSLLPPVYDSVIFHCFFISFWLTFQVPYSDFTPFSLFSFLFIISLVLNFRATVLASFSETLTNRASVGCGNTYLYYFVFYWDRRKERAGVWGGRESIEKVRSVTFVVALLVVTNFWSLNCDVAILSGSGCSRKLSTLCNG